MADNPTDVPANSERLRPTASKWRSGLASLSILLIAPVLALLLSSFVFQQYQVSGMSMQNTLQNNDRLIVWKGSRSWARFFGGQYIPGRGDIVIVNEQNLTACNQGGKVIIKRVIGLPDDHVVYKSGRYTVYNSAHPQGFDPDTTLPYGTDGTALLADPDDPAVEVRLSSTQLFVSGDHRADSCDSRRIGPVAAGDIIGKLILRVTPLSHAERF